MDTTTIEMGFVLLFLTIISNKNEDIQKDVTKIVSMYTFHEIVWTKNNGYLQKTCMPSICCIIIVTL